MWTMLAGICAVLAPIAGVFLWIYLMSSERGERYMKQRMQGPFVPVHPDADQDASKTK